ncbi:MAG: hypothetical protein AAF211_23825 [Myxococcota bacterium]
MALTDLLAVSDHGIASAALWALKGGYHESTLTDNVTVDQTYPQIVGFDPGGANRTVTLDGSADAAGDGAVDGLMRVIVNKADAAESLTVQDAAGPNVIGTVSQNQAGVFYHDEETGWALVCLFSIALS